MALQPLRASFWGRVVVAPEAIVMSGTLAPVAVGKRPAGGTSDELDSNCDDGQCRDALEARKIKACIPPRSNRTKELLQDLVQTTP